MTRPVFGRDRDPVAARSFRNPTPAQRDAAWLRDRKAWAARNPACICECPECIAHGIHLAHPHTEAAP